ncbi:MAG TPA: hypothetical protein VI197_27115, partial [Polyangiaceae bacterium]
MHPPHTATAARPSNALSAGTLSKRAARAREHGTRPHGVRGGAWCVGGSLGLFLMGCGIETDPPVDTEVRTTHAVVTIERSESADGSSSKAEALAGFLEVPALVDAHSVLQLVGLGLDLPEPGSCTLGAARATAGPLTETANVEFVDAGAVELEVSGARERLAPYAFPTVTDSISGVLYTSRDRAADPLPSGSRYTLTAAGSGLGLRVSHDAPHALSGVTVNGTPLAEVAGVGTSNPLDLTWDVDAPGDIVYVELTASSAQSAAQVPSASRRVICSFADELGAGSVPTEAFAAGGTGRVSVHRLRT